MRVMTFNIRNSEAQDGQNEWAVRRNWVAQFIYNIEPDVVGMQEVLPDQMAYLKDSLSSKYEGYGVARDDGDSIGEACPIFYRTDRFTRLTQGNFWLSDTPGVPSRSWGAACNRVCTWVMLQDKRSQRVFIVANTHLDHVSEQARTRGIILIKQRLAAIANNCPIILAGDFNAAAGGDTYQAALGRVFTMQDCYPKAEKTGGQRSTYQEYGNVPDSEGERIDFIFTTEGINVKRAYIYNSMIDVGQYLSDHNAVFVDLSDKHL